MSHEDIGIKAYRRRVTKDRLAEIQEKFRKEKEAYERENKVLLSNERQKVLRKYENL